MTTYRRSSAATRREYATWDGEGETPHIREGKEIVSQKTQQKQSVLHRMRKTLAVTQFGKHIAEPGVHQLSSQTEGESPTFRRATSSFNHGIRTSYHVERVVWIRTKLLSSRNGSWIARNSREKSGRNAALAPERVVQNRGNHSSCVSLLYSTQIQLNGEKIVSGSRARHSYCERPRDVHIGGAYRDSSGDQRNRPQRQGDQSAEAHLPQPPWI